jgi:3-methyladenine DNA glycosylase AlkC
MGNPIYEEDMRGKTQQQMNPMQMLQNLKNDPVSFVRQKGFNLPDDVDTRNPQSIINALMQSEQVSRNAYQSAMQRMMRR